jgi:hypothetical protein
MTNTLGACLVSYLLPNVLIPGAHRATELPCIRDSGFSVVLTSRNCLLVPEKLHMAHILGYLWPGEKPTVDTDKSNFGIGSAGGQECVVAHCSWTTSNKTMRNY